MAPPCRGNPRDAARSHVRLAVFWIVCVSIFALILKAMETSRCIAAVANYQIETTPAPLSAALLLRDAAKQLSIETDTVTATATQGSEGMVGSDKRATCSANLSDINAIQIDPFPASFDRELYVRRNENQRLNSEALDLEHYNTIGKQRGWVASNGQESVRSLLNDKIVPNLPGNVLEIGPFLNPTLKPMGGESASKVKYFDVLDLEGLKARAAKINYPSVHPVPIDYVEATGNLAAIPPNTCFSLVVSSHAIEHQMDLVRHLIAVSNLLMEGGFYTMIVPDKRFCFDHFVPETSIAEVLDDFFEKRHGAHKLKSVIEHRALTAHNGAREHWEGNHGPQYTADIVARVQNAIDEYLKSGDSYIDVHNYQFTPQSMAFLIDTLYKLRLIDLQVHRLYETVKGQLEFSIVLQRRSQVET